MLVFDVKVLQDARDYADANQIKIFEANIIYHLFDQFIAHVKNCQEERKRNEGKDAIFPCMLRIVAIFNKKDPIILGVDVEQGVLKAGTPVCVYNSEVHARHTPPTIETHRGRRRVHRVQPQERQGGTDGQRYN